MGFRIEINRGYAWERLENVSLDDTKVDIGRDESPRVRIQPSGQLTCYGGSYDVIKGERDSGANSLSYRLLYNDNPLYKASLVLYGTYNEAAHTCRLNIYSEDRYTKLLRNAGEKINITSPLRAIRPGKYYAYQVKLVQRAMVEYVTDGQLDFSNTDWRIIGGTNSANPLPWNEFSCYTKAKQYEHANGYALIGDKDKSFVQHFGNNYACLEDSVGASPGDDSDVWIQVSAEYVEVAQYTSPMWFPTFKTPPGIGQPYPVITSYDAQDKLYVIADTDRVWRYGRFYPLNLFDVLEEVLTEADSTVTIDQSTYLNIVNSRSPDIEDLIIYRRAAKRQSSVKAINQSIGSEEVKTCDEDPYLNLSLDDILDIYKALFNVDWYLTDSNEFRFIHPTEVCQTLPDIKGEPANFINQHHSKDFSSSVFTETDSATIGRESWTVGSMFYLESEFGTQEIIYDNVYEDVREHRSQGFETDAAAVESENATNIVVAATSAALSGIFKVVAYREEVPLEYPIYNSALAAAHLLKTYFLDDRPYVKGEHKGVAISLTKKRTNEATINIPLINPLDINFDKQLVTTYGNLMPLNVEADSAKGIVTIRATKQ